MARHPDHKRIRVAVTAAQTSRRSKGMTMPDELFQLVIPWLKLHPWALYALALGMAVSWGWSATPKAAKAWVRAIRWGIGPRAAGLLDALVAATPTAPNVVRAIWHGVVMGRSKPERMTQQELDALIARELARVTPTPNVVVAPTVEGDSPR